MSRESINDRAVMTRISTVLLIELINASATAQPFYRQLGISDQDFIQLTCMNARELRNVADSGILRIEIDVRTLNRAVQRVLISRDEQNLIKDAIRLGAGRAILHEYANISFQRYNDLVAELGFGEQRNGRPPMLSERELSDLADYHARYIKAYSISTKKEHLKCLVYLATHTNLDIKRIYNYFYSDNMILYQEICNG